MKSMRLVAMVAVLASFVFGWEGLNIKSNNKDFLKAVLEDAHPSGDYVSMDRIVGRNPETGEVEPVLKEVGKEEYEMIKAKELNKKAYKKAEEARMKLERAKQSGDEAKIKEAERKLEDFSKIVAFIQENVKETAKFMLDIARQTSEDKLDLENRDNKNSIRRKTHRR